MKDSKEKVKYTIVFNLTKVNDDWAIDELDDTTKEKSQVNLFRISTENAFESQFLLIPGGMQIPKAVFTFS